jgi:osmoprotectant transport system substrate-binding protein
MTALLRAIAVAVLATLAVGLGACGGDDTAKTPTVTTAPTPSAAPIRIGTKDFTEEYILGELYGQALEAKGFDVELKRDIGSSEIIHQALGNGALDMYPEYIGVLLSEVANNTMRPSSPAGAYRLAQQFEERRGFALLEATPFSDSNALAVTPAFARRKRVRSISHLRRLSPKPRIGAPKEFRTRFEGLIGLRELYGLRKPRFTPLLFDRRYPSLDSGRVDVTLVLTTEPQLTPGRYVVLADPRRLFASGHVAPIINKKVLAAHGPGLRAAIDAVSKKLTLAAMRRMNGDVDIRRRTPREVAMQFLRAQDLL